MKYKGLLLLTFFQLLSACQTHQLETPTITKITCYHIKSCKDDLKNHLLKRSQSLAESGFKKLPRQWQTRSYELYKQIQIGIKVYAAIANVL